MKKQMSILMVMMMIVAPLAALPLGVGGESAPVGGPLFSGAGSGTPGDPYQITNDTQLQEMELELAAHYILVDDIDASITSAWNSGAGFSPIGDQATPFMGSLEGQNYSISDLFINIPDMQFDYIIINPPYYSRDPREEEEYAWFCGSNFEYFKSLFSSLSNYIGKDSKVYMILSEVCDIQKIKSIGMENEFVWKLKMKKQFWGENNYIFEISKS